MTSSIRKSVLDTIECATYGWQDKPRLMPRREKPLDGGDPIIRPTGEEEPRPSTRAPIQDAILSIMQRRGADGGWVMREAIASPIGWSCDSNITQALIALVKAGRIERGQSTGARTCYRLMTGTRPPTPRADGDIRNAMQRALGHQWITTQGLAERLQCDPGRVLEHGHALIDAGLAECKREEGLSKKEARRGFGKSNYTGNGAAIEWRASTKLLVSRLKPRKA